MKRIAMIDKILMKIQILYSALRVAKTYNTGYNSLLGLVKVRQTFCIFNLISSPKILADFQQRNHNPKPLPHIR